MNIALWIKRMLLLSVSWFVFPIDCLVVGKERAIEDWKILWKYGFD